MSSLTPQFAHQPPSAMVVDQLERLHASVPGITACLLLSADGLTKAHVGLTGNQDEHLAAACSGLASLVKGIGNFLHEGRASTTRQVLIDTDQEALVLMEAGDGSVLLVLASLSADVHTIGDQMGKFVTALRPHLTTPARQTGAAPAGEGG